MMIRLTGAMALPCLLLLAGCSAAALRPAAPFPADYAAIASRSVERIDGARYGVSQPREIPDWSSSRGPRWYVCVRRDGGVPDVLLLSSVGRAETRIADSAGQFCAGASYAPFTPAPNAMPTPLSLGPKVATPWQAPEPRAAEQPVQ